MIGRGLVIGGVAALVVFGAGCAPSPPASPPPASSAPAVLDAETAAAPGVESNGGTYFVRYRFQDPPPLNEPFAVSVWVSPADDRDAVRTDVDLIIDGRMPDHRHGMNRAQTITRRDDGGFDVTGMQFHMPGYWQIHFDIVDGALTERAQIDVTLN